MCYIHAFKEAIYELKLQELITLLNVKNGHPVMRENVALASQSINLVVLRWLFDDFWLAHTHEHWQLDRFRIMCKDTATWGWDLCRVA